MGMPVLTDIQLRNDVVLTYPAGWPDSQPRLDTKETIPICVHKPPYTNENHCSFCFKTRFASNPIYLTSSIKRGPPESPLHVLCELLSHPKVHNVDGSTTDGPYDRVHWSFDIIRLSTQFKSVDNCCVPSFVTSNDYFSCTHFD